VQIDPPLDPPTQQICVTHCPDGCEVIDKLQQRHRNGAKRENVSEQIRVVPIPITHHINEMIHGLIQNAGANI
jgi:hypothetical protein